MSYGRPSPEWFRRRHHHHQSHIHGDVPGQLNLLPSAGPETSAGQSAVIWRTPDRYITLFAVNAAGITRHSLSSVTCLRLRVQESYRLITHRVLF